MQRTRLLLILCAGLLVLPAACQMRRAGSGAMPPGPYSSLEKVPVPELPAFAPEMPEKATLSNGITVLLMPDDSRPVVELSFDLHAGSFDDPSGRAGLAGLTAEVMRSGGSAAWPGDGLDEELGFLGAEIGFQAQRDRMGGGLACLVEDFDQVLGMFADLLQRPAFPQDKLDLALDGLRSAVLQRNDDPGQAASREAQRAFYGPGDPRSRRVEMSDIDAIGRGDLEDFHRQQVGRKGALIAVYGDFERGAMLGKLEQAFGGLPAQGAEPRQWPLGAPQTGGRRVFLVNRPDVNQTEIRFVEAGVRRDDPDYPALQLGSFVYGTGGFSSRMIATVRTEMGLAYTTGAIWRASFEREGVVWAWAGTKNETCILAANAMLGVLESFLNGEVDARQFAGARQRLMNAEVFQFDTPSETLDRIADLEFYGYPWDYYQKLSERIRSLSLEEVLAATRRHLDLGTLTFFVMGNAAQFDGDVGQFGPVIPWDLDAPDGGAGGMRSGY